ncbi:hypothetical protein [Sphaerisporangium fuscum]|uniref:hypothetical protein n=1 Tax=Sphaerisporangium fuscum TaxID=2835868 RepID=UPI001BDCA878|nr:hypothetical protein [Sphaerisporangium fuscum]
MRTRHATLSIVTSLLVALSGAALTEGVPASAEALSRTSTQAVQQVTGGRYFPARARVLDNVEVEPGATMAVKVAGAASLPATGLESVAVNVAAKGNSDSGSVVVYPSGELEPDAAAVSYDKAHYAATTLVTRVGADGQINIVNQGTDKVRVYMDVQGYTLQQGDGQGASYVGLDPKRILAPTTLGAGANFQLEPLGKGGVPTSGVQAVAVMVTAKSTSSGTVRVYPSGEGWPVDATIDYQANAAQQSFTIAKLGADGKVNIHNLGFGSAQVAVDVVGYLTTSTPSQRAVLRSIPPVQIAEKLVVPAGGDKSVDPRGLGGVPVVGTDSVGLGVTAYGSGSGTVQLHPTGTAVPEGQTLTYAPDTEITGFTMTKLGTGGKVDVHNSGSAPVTVWVNTYAYTQLVDPVLPTPKTAGEAIENVTGVADVAAAATGDADNIAVTTTTDDSGTTTVKVPKDPRQGITVTAEAGTTTLKLPASGAATRTDAGTVVYKGTTDSYSIGVQPTTDGGFRTLAYLADSSAPTSYSFPMTLPDGAHLAIDELDGSALIVKEHAGGEESVLLEEITRIQKPWAKDAGGHSWPTSYTVDGDTLKLNIDLTPVTDASGATVSPVFPVVADPRVKRNCGIVTCSWYFSKATTRWLKSKFDNYGWTVATASGIICGNLPHPVAKGACAIAIAYYYNSAFNNTRRAYNRGGCLVVRVNVFYGATPYTAWRTVRFDNVPLSNRYCYSS